VRETGLRGDDSLQTVFADPRFSHALTPLRAASADDTRFLSSNPSDAELQALAEKYGLNQVLIVETSGNVTDVSLDWIALQDAINTSAQIKGARLDALSKDGALMTISYGGDLDRMANELRFKGVRVEQDPRIGLVFRRS